MADKLEYFSFTGHNKKIVYYFCGAKLFWVVACIYSVMKKFLLCSIFFLSAVAMLSAQVATKIKGMVKDAHTGEPLPFAVVYFTGTTVGATTDMDGCYYLETRQNVPPTVTAELLGYTSQEAKVVIGGFTELDFLLEQSSEFLESVVVKADNKRIKAFLKRIYEQKQYNDPKYKETFSCKTYNKMELGLTNVNPQMKNKLLQKNFGFVFTYMDTSAVSGRPYLPVMITESSSRYYHRKNPPLSREIIDASRISGVNEDYSLAQFTGQMHGKIDLYDNYVDLFNIKIASPLSEHGLMFYDYYLIDSLNVEGRKTYMLRFHPKSKSTPVFDGEFWIDSTTMALQQAHIKLVKGVNVNWVRDMVIDVENQLVNDSTWFYKQEKLYVDFSVTMRDSSKLVSFIGNRTVNYSNPEFNEHIPQEVLSYSTNVVINEDVLNNDNEFWEKERPFMLSQKEQNIYNMVDSIKKVPLFNTIQDIVYTFMYGYYDLGKIEIGPYYKLLSFNDLEGTRFQFGARTTTDWHKKLRLTAYVAYGTDDKEFKGGGIVEYMFNRMPVRKITANYRHDALQLGAGENAFTEGNIMGSILSKGSDRLCIVDKLNISYEHEWREWIITKLYTETQKITGNGYVPLLHSNGTMHYNAIYSTSVGVGLRFGFNEIVNRKRFDVTRFMGRYPVITFDFKAGLKDLFNGGYEYYRGEGGIRYNLSIPPLGTSYFTVNVGKIWGNVPYPLLKIHEGNGTYFNNPGSFSCMDYYEFASDAWVSWFYEHNFKGFFLSKIPLLKKLQWREVISLRGVYGTLRNANNGSAEYFAKTDNAAGNIECAELLFPHGMGGVSKPYLEAGVGITNIFRIFRIDSYWRLNHKYNYLGEKNTSWVINFGIELKF